MLCCAVSWLQVGFSESLSHTMKYVTVELLAPWCCRRGGGRRGVLPGRRAARAAARGAPTGCRQPAGPRAARPGGPRAGERGAEGSWAGRGTGGHASAAARSGRRRQPPVVAAARATNFAGSKWQVACRQDIVEV